MYSVARVFKIRIMIQWEANLMFRLVIKYGLRDRRKLGYTVFGIAISVALSLCLLETADYIVQIFTHLSSEGQKYDMAFVKIERFQQDLIEKYLTEKNYKGYLSGDFLGDIYLENNSAPVTIMGFEGDLEYLLDVSVKEGNLPQKDSEICLELSENNSLAHPYKIGDSISVTIYDDKGDVHALQFTLSGLVSDMPFAGGFALIPLHRCNAFKEKWKLSGDSYRFTQICCGNEYDEENIFQYERDISTILWGKEYYRNWPEHLSQNDTKAELYAEKGTYESYSQALRGVCILLSLCTAIFIYSRFSVYMWEKISLFGILQCLGSNKKDVLIFLLEISFLTAFVGGASGFLLGNVSSFFLSRKIIFCFIGRLHEAAFSFRLAPYINAFLIVSSSVLAGDIVVFLSICRKTPIEMLQGVGMDHSFPIHKKRNRRKRQEKFPAGKVWYIVSKRTGQYFVQGITMFICMLLCMTIIGLFFHMNQRTVSDISGIFPVRIRSGVSPEQWEITQEQVEQLKKIDGVQNVYTQYVSYDYKAMTEDGQEVLISICSDELFSLFLTYTNDIALKNVDYRKSNLSILFSKDPIDSFKIEVSTEKELRKMYPAVQEKYEIPVILHSLDIDNIFIKDIGYPLLLINERLAEKLKMSKNSTSIYMRLNHLREKSDILRDVNDIFGGEGKVDILDDDAMYRKESILKGMILLAGFTMLSTLIAVLSMIANTIQSEYERKRNVWGIFCVLGMTKQNMIKLSVFQQIKITLAAGCFSAGIANWVIYYVCQVLEREYIWESIGISFLIICLFCFIVSCQCFLVLNGKKESIGELMKNNAA